MCQFNSEGWYTYFDLFRLLCHVLLASYSVCREGSWTPEPAWELGDVISGWIIVCQEFKRLCKCSTFRKIKNEMKLYEIEKDLKYYIKLKEILRKILNRSLLRSQILTMSQLSCLRSVSWACNQPLTKGQPMSCLDKCFWDCLLKKVPVRMWISEVQKECSANM